MPPLPKFSQQYQVMSSDVDFTRKLKLSALFNYFQEIAALHADNIGYGLNDIYEKHGVVWVLIRIKVEIIRYPLWEDRITVETWPQTPKKYEFERDYRVTDSEGNVIIKAISNWAIIDAETRELRKSELLALDYPDFITERAIYGSMGKIKPAVQPEIAYKRLIGCSDIDMNGHINNSKYIDFIMDCFTMEELKTYQAEAIQMKYVKEAFPGETIVLKKSSGLPETGIIYIEGVNEKDGSLIFQAEINAVPRGVTPI